MAYQLRQIDIQVTKYGEPRLINIKMNKYGDPATLDWYSGHYKYGEPATSDWYSKILIFRSATLIVVEWQPIRQLPVELILGGTYRQLDQTLESVA